MLLRLFILFYSFLIIDQKHFNGGTINWAPIDPYDNSSTVPITITQTYSWTYPYISCANNVPISTSGWSGANRNLTCVVDCSTDGGYSTHPVNILTDCTSASTSLGMLSSTRPNNITLNAGAHFYIAYLGSAWVALNYPAQSGLEWSIITLIDLRMRPDGFINTPPVASVVSPQYAFVNQTIQINIPVSDANAGDDVRCRWANYTSGYRRRKRSDIERYKAHKSIAGFYEKVVDHEEIIHIRRKRSCPPPFCGSNCTFGCGCGCSDCDNSICTVTCALATGCGPGAVVDTTTTSTTSTTTKTTTSTTTTKTTTSTTSTKTTTSTTSTETTTSTTSTKTTTSTTSTKPTTSTTSTETTTSTTSTKTTTSTTSTEATTTTTTVTTTTTTTTDTSTTTTATTTETMGTLKSTSSYPNRQAINECGGICYPGSVPNGTTLSNCTITFTASKAGVWYAVALQVEDFINDTSTTPMSSVPVQFLIYVLPQPQCSQAPIIFPLSGCLEVEAGISMSFNLTAMSLCNRTVSNLTDIVVSSGISGMSKSNLTNVPTNLSLSYVTFTWTPQDNQVGFQELCVIAFTSERVQSSQYCVVFTVKNSSDVCVTTTTTSTSTTTESTTSTSATTTTATSTSTSATTSTTSETTTTSSTSTSTTSSTTSTTTSSTSATSTTSSTTSTSTSTTTSTTSTTSTTTSTTSTTTSTTTSSTSTSSTSTSTTTSSTSTTTTSVTTTTSTSTTSTTATTVTTTTITTTTTGKVPNKSTNWLLILGLSLLALLLAICCSCFCLYWFLWGPAARRRRKKNYAEGGEQQTVLWRNRPDLTQPIRAIRQLYQPSSLSNDPLVNSTRRATMSSFPTDLSRSLCDSATVLTDLEEHKTSSTVSVKKISRSDIANMNNIQKFNQSRNADINSAKNYDDSDGNSLASQHPTVTVLQMNRLPNTDKTNKRISSVNRPQASSGISTTPSKTAQVNLDKLSRIKSTTYRRPRAASVGNVSVAHVDRSSIEMRTIANHSKTSMPATDHNVNTGNGVRVTKLPRRLRTTKSHFA